MIIKTYQELSLVNPSYDVGLQTPRGRNAPQQPRLFQWVNWFKCGAMTDVWAQAVIRLFNWQRCSLSLTTGAGFCFRVKGNSDHKTPVQPVSNRRDYGIFTSSGLCFLSQSLSAAFMRVCQPSPVALNALRTSDEYRILTGIFGQSVTGRPLRRNFFNWLYGTNFTLSSSTNTVSGSEATALRIFASSSSVGNIVPGFNLSFDMAFNLAFVCLSKADYSAFVIVTVSKYDAINTVMQIAKSYKSVLPVIVAHINANNGRFPLEKLRLNQRYAVLTLIGCVFVWIKGDFHAFIVATKNDFANLLHWLAVLSYAYPAPYKTGAGRGNPKLSKATPDAASVFFVVRHMRHSMAWCAIHPQGLRCRLAGLLSHHAAHNGTMCCIPFGVSLPLWVRVTVISRVNSTSRRPIMVTLAGQPQGWPVPFDAGISTPVNVTAIFERGNSSGDSLIQSKEAVTMATTPTQNPQFIWLIAAVRRDMPTITAQIHHIAAETEHEARQTLAREHVTFFAGRIRLEVSHA
ncbi:TPA: host cell division inhibitor Icd-like protein [Salmonella enterica subsp. enterica serovar Muenchen]